MHRLTIRRLALPTLAALALLVPVASAAGFSETKTFSSNELTVSNLVGAVTVTEGGSSFEVTVNVRGSDASKSKVRIETDSDSLRVVFPDSERFVYPELGSSRVRFSPSSSGDGGWLHSLLGLAGDRVEVSKDGRGTEVWADVEIRVPAGGALTVRHGAGAIRASGVEGDLDLGCRAGAIEVEDVVGDVSADTGSGKVVVAGVRGAVLVDTGSGGVEVSRIEGPDVSIDTGSGSVDLEDVTADGEIAIDTGSGRVKMRSVAGRAFSIDTGSGGVEAYAIRADSMMIDTGSGGVELELLAMGDGNFVVDTGSGGITLALPADADCTVEAETGGGRMQVDVASAVDVRGDDDHVSFVLGGGRARVELDAGSGTVRIGNSL